MTKPVQYLNHSNRRFRKILRAVAVLTLLAFPTFAKASDGPPGSEELHALGKRIYAKSCVACHGDAGQGVKDKYDEPLTGDATVGQLARLISETMPEEEPESCVSEDAEAVAAYIHYAFYSRAARVRNRPPRVELARLTGEQLRQSLADLYAHFFDPPWVDERSGIEGYYFNGEKWDEGKKKSQRIDPAIDFDFANESPAKGVDPKEYYIYWSGSLKVDRTGRYQIILRSTCSCRLRFGHPHRTLIDNHVQSEGREEFRRTLHLTAGRAYRIELDFTQRKRKTKQPPARISLSWVPPGGIEEVIPNRNLIPAGYPPAFALQTKLPPDDRSYGYDRGTAISRQWDDSTSAAAIEFSQVVAQEAWPQYRKRHRRDGVERRELLRRFLMELVETAFRGPIDASLQKVFIDASLDQHVDDAEAIKQSVLLTLKSPRFLYPSIDSSRSRSRQAANRLALTLFDSLPSDAWLLKKAEKGQLQTPKQIREAAERMVKDYRMRAKVRGLIDQWLDIAHLEPISKDQELHPGFDRELVQDLHVSLNQFVDEVVWSRDSDFRELLRSEWAYTTDRMADFYGDGWQSETKDGPSLRRSVNDPNRRGVLTHPLLLSHFAYHKHSSPVHRGVFLVRHLLGRTLRPPNAAFSPLNPDLHPKLTTRQRVELQTNEVSCQVCHAKINSLGFALEQYDAVGRYRTKEKKVPVDAKGSYVDRDGRTNSFDGAAELASYLVGSRDCHQAFVEVAFKYLVKQPIAAYGADASDRLTEGFIENDFNIRELLIDIAVLVADNED